MKLVDFAPEVPGLIETFQGELRAGPDLPDRMADFLKSSGLVRLWAPKALGGAELPPLAFVELIEDIARLDASTAWCAAVASNTSRLSGLLPRDRADEIMGEEGFASGSMLPPGMADREGDGWRVNAHWMLASFSRHSPVVGGLCLLREGGELMRAGNGQPLARLVIVPREQAEIVETWNGAGLPSSGSHDIAIRDLWVPDERMLDPLSAPSSETFDSPLYAIPYFTAFAVGLVGVPLGIASASIEAFRELAQRKHAFGGTAPLREIAAVQVRVAQGAASLAAARAFVRETVGDLWVTVSAGGDVTHLQRALVRMACWNAAKSAKKVVDRMFSLAGASALAADSRLAALARDVAAAVQHSAFADYALEPAGRVLLGTHPGGERI